MSAPWASSRSTRPGQRPEARQGLLDAGGVGPAGVHRGGRDVVERPPVGQQRQHLDLHPLGPGVGRRRRVVARRYSGSSARSVWLYMPPLLTSTTRPPASCGPQRLGHHDRAEDVHGHAQLVALRGLGALGRHHAGVVHDGVDRGQLGRRRRRRSGVRRRGRPRRSATPAAHAPGSRRGDLVADPTTLGLVAHHEVHRAPSAARPSTVAIPSPELAPVTSTSRARQHARARGRPASRAACGARPGRSWCSRAPGSGPSRCRAPGRAGAPTASRPLGSRSRHACSWSTVLLARNGRYAATTGAAKRAAPANANSAV